MDVTLSDAEATVSLGRRLGRVIRDVQTEEGERVRVILFFGELGAGKTTFMRGFVEHFPGGNDAEVSSPSFTLCNRYPTEPPILHCDLYRSEGGTLPDEVEEALDAESGLVLVEWAERIPFDALPAKRLDIRFQVCKNNRLVMLSPHGEAACRVLRKLEALDE